MKGLQSCCRTERDVSETPEICCRNFVTRNPVLTVKPFCKFTPGQDWIVTPWSYYDADQVLCAATLWEYVLFQPRRLRLIQDDFYIRSSGMSISRLWRPYWTVFNVSEPLECDGREWKGRRVAQAEQCIATRYRLLYISQLMCMFSLCLNRDSQPFSEHVPFQHFDRWTCTTKISSDKKAKGNNTNPPKF